MSKPPIIAIVGFSDSGKTRLMVELIARLKRRGYRVASLKHCHDGFAFDVAGKDSWKHKRAGAQTSLMVGRSQVGLVVDLPTPLDLVALCTHFVHDTDIILAEGFSWEPVPKILVASRANFAEEKCSDDPHLIALVNAQNAPSRFPRFTFAESSLEALTQWLEQHYLNLPDASPQSEAR
jgi:molybdopterin-guanine dinucleotide biosynthesis protein B